MTGSVDDLRLIDALCVEFESAWREGRSPLIEALLGGVDERLRSSLFVELLAIEVDWRRQGNDEIELAELRHRFGEWESLFECGFASLVDTGSLVDVDDAARMDDEPRLPVGMRLGAYRLEEHVGRGGFGHVYRAIHLELEREVALKVSRRLPDKPEVWGRFRQEAQILARVDHPHIMPVFDSWIEGERYCLASRFIHGGSLAELLKGGPTPSSTQAVRWTCQVAEALSQAHGEGFVHRDVKPANIMIDQQGNAVLIDFGIAAVTEELASQAGASGTVSYMSPEQSSNESRQVDARSDLFSLGIVLFELLTGRRPFRGTSAHEIKNAIQSRDPPAELLGHVPDPLRAICLRCLRKEPAARFQTARELADVLLSFLEPPVMPAVQRAVVSPAPTRARRWPALIAVACVVAVAVMASMYRSSLQHSLQEVAAPRSAVMGPLHGYDAKNYHPRLEPSVIEVDCDLKLNDQPADLQYFEATPGRYELRFRAGALDSLPAAEAVFPCYADGGSAFYGSDEAWTEERHSMMTGQPLASRFELPAGTHKFSVVSALVVRDAVGDSHWERTSHSLCVFYAYPDLTYADATIDRAAYRPGESIRLRVSVLNCGTVASQAGQVRVAFSTRQSTADGIVTNLPFAELEAGRKQELAWNFAIPLRITSGWYCLGLLVDAENASQERDELPVQNWQHGTKPSANFIPVHDDKRPPNNNECFFWFEIR